MVNCPHDKTIHCEFELTMRTSPTTSFCAAIQVVRKAGERASGAATHPLLPVPESHPGGYYASLPDDESGEQNAFIKAFIAVPESIRDEIYHLPSEFVLNLFYRGHALLLVGTRFLVRRNNHGIATQFPRTIHNRQIFPRTFHDLSTVTIFPRSRSFHGHDLSTVTIFPRSRSFHGHDLSTVIPRT
jgi:hypothetical protein